MTLVRHFEASVFPLVLHLRRSLFADLAAFCSEAVAALSAAGAGADSGATQREEQVTPLVLQGTGGGKERALRWLMPDPKRKSHSEDLVLQGTRGNERACEGLCHAHGRKISERGGVVVVVGGGGADN